jgi:hypothetical protein
MWIEVDTHGSKQGLKETNKIKTKQQKKAKAKAKENQKLQNTLYLRTNFKCQNTLHSKRVNYLFLIPISHSKNGFLAKPIVLAAIQSPSFSSICIAVDVACAWKITAHLL